MTVERTPVVSGRRDELLEAAYRHVLDHGLAGMSLRPLAAAVGSSPRVLLFLFESKDGLVRALLSRARADETELLGRLSRDAPVGLAPAAREIWGWLAAPEHRGVLRLWLESYARSLVEPDGPWSGFGQATVRDWLDLLAAAQPREERDSPAGAERRTAALAVLRGGLLDLLATDEVKRVTAAVHRTLASLQAAAR